MNDNAIRDRALKLLDDAVAFAGMTILATRMRAMPIETREKIIGLLRKWAEMPATSERS